MSDAPIRREPIFKIPLVIIGFIAVCGLVHLARQALGRDADFELVARFAFVPARLTAWLDPSAVAARITAWFTANDADTIRQVTALRFFLAQASPPALTLVTYTFLHGDWMHLGFNSLWLLAFGTPVARRFGPARFLALMLVATVAGALTHWACFPFGVDPVIGASAAVSGCMGAAVRFVFETPDPLRADAAGIPASPLSSLWRNRRAMSFLVVWFASNALFGIGSFSFGLTEAPVAWQAHIGGFLVGLLLFSLFDPRLPPAVQEPVAPSDPAPAA